MDNTEINGYQNEIMFAKKINGKKIKDLYLELFSEEDWKLVEKDFKKHLDRKHEK